MYEVMQMDVVSLARLQFAFTVAYHFLFVPFSLGTGLMLVIAEQRYYKTGKAQDRAMSDFFKKLFAACFAIGVATGITMEFAFGTNWATYSRFVGDIFGAPLAAEGVFAFFLESTFLGVLLFGRERVSKKFYLVSTWLVFLGSHLSAVWIIIANSWQQTPAGFVVRDGRAILTNFFAAALNPSTLPRFFHTVASAWVVGAGLAAAVAAWYLLKGRHTEFAKTVLKIALPIAVIMTLVMPVTGHWSADTVAKHQPVKLAAFEGQYPTESNATLWIAGWVDENTKKVVGIGIPSGLSLLVGFNPNTSIQGLDAVPPADRPPVQFVFQSYHLMVSLGMLMILIAAAGWVLNRMGRLEGNRLALWSLIGLPIFAQLSIQAGWFSAEVGRQPWIVQDLLRTTDAISKVVPAGSIIFTLTLFAVVYLVLFIGWARIFFGVIGKGPAELAGVTADPVPAPTGQTAAAVATASSMERG
jgi:cytochrome d ubiquinol oxidase subunit I